MIDAQKRPDLQFCDMGAADWFVDLAPNCERDRGFGEAANLLMLCAERKRAVAVRQIAVNTMASADDLVGLAGLSVDSLRSILYGSFVLTAGMNASSDKATLIAAIPAQDPGDLVLLLDVSTLTTHGLRALLYAYGYRGDPTIDRATVLDTWESIKGAASVPTVPLGVRRSAEIMSFVRDLNRFHEAQVLALYHRFRQEVDVRAPAVLAPRECVHVCAREQQIGGSGGSLEPPGPLS